MMKIRNFVIMMCCLIALCSCGGGGKHDAEFRRIDNLCDTEPEQDIRVLDSIDRSTLSEKDHHCFDLLTIKSRDNAKMSKISRCYRIKTLAVAWIIYVV